MTAPDDGPLAYKNAHFIDGDDARPLRILAEYLAPLEAFRRERIHDTIVFFGSARLAPDGPLGRYYEEARERARKTEIPDDIQFHPFHLEIVISRLYFIL